MTRCTAHMATFCSCRFKRDTLGFRVRAHIGDLLRRVTPRSIGLGDWP